MPAHWRVERFKWSLRYIEQGWSPQCDNFPAEDDEWGVLKVGAVNDARFRPSENKRLPADFEPVVAYEVKAGDLLMSRANTTGLVGSMALVEETRPRLLLCDKLYRLGLNTARLNPYFVVYFFQSASGRFEFEGNASGASNSMQNISQDTVREVLIPVPPLEEQREIVAHVAGETARLDALRAATEQSLSLLGERRTALVAEAVAGERVLH